MQRQRDSVSEDVQSLCGTARFEDIAAPVRKSILDAGRRLVFKPGQTIFEQGDPHTHTYIIEQGLVRTYYTSYTGRHITLCYWSDGDLIGGPNFFGDTTHVWSGVVTRQTRVIAIKGETLRQLAMLMPQLAMWITDAAMFKLRWLSLLFQLQGTQSVSQRLPHLLYLLSEMYGVKENDVTVIRHCLNQSEIAALLGTSRQWTNKAMVELRQQGLVSVEQGRITILNLTGLLKCAVEGIPSRCDEMSKLSTG
ncbi:MAG TPA: Crp/Fnr family transcriptional regulator [Hyphomicrobiaceae bacterium]|nr:Crp/Fnr family transcriptional regulator [Hyphomicrobiaceae bacterium]